MWRGPLPRELARFRWAVLGAWMVRGGLLVGVLVALKEYGVI